LVTVAESAAEGSSEEDEATDSDEDSAGGDE
jgi:hypothetical protein